MRSDLGPLPMSMATRGVSWLRRHRVAAVLVAVVLAIRDLLDTQVLRQLQPDIVTVAIGGNDVRSYDSARFARDVETLTAALPAGALMADVPDFMAGRWEDYAVESRRAR